MERMRNRLRAELMASDAITAQARRTELQDEITVVRIRAEEQAKRTAFVEANVERMRAQPAAVPLVTNYYNNMPTTNVANVFQNFQNFQNFSTQFTQNVYHAHQNTINHVTNNATRAINMAVKLALPLSDAYQALPTKPRRAEILNVLANGRGDDDDDIPPAAGAVRRAVHAVENTPSSSSGINSAPQPLALTNSPNAPALPLQPLNESERSTPYHVPVDPKRKPRLLDKMTKIKATPPPAPPANYLPPSYLVPPPRIQLEDAPIRIKRGTRMEDVVVELEQKSKKAQVHGLWRGF